MTDQKIEADAFRPLPVERTQKGEARRIGVEVEFSGLSEAGVAKLLQDKFGGDLDSENPHILVIHGSAIGDFQVELDTALSKKVSGRAGSRAMDLLRGLVPVEVVTGPLTREEVARFDTVIPDLRAAGASGSRNGIFLGFGVHLNIEVVADEAPHTMRTIRAFALLDPVLRDWYGIDMTRRVLPFVNSWPSAFVGLLVREKPASLEDLIDLSDPHVRTRNHALDLLPLFKWSKPELFETTFPGDHATSARPAFHFRLPDSRIDESDWSLQEPWDMWRMVEEVAASDQLKALEEAWIAHVEGSALGRTEGAWVEAAQGILERVAR